MNVGALIILIIINKEEKRPNASILIAASLIAAVRLNREEIK